MAHAGTTSTSTGQIGLWKALLTAIVVMAIGLAIVLAITFAGSRSAGVSSLDRSQDQIEAQRGAATVTGISVDRSYDTIENQRGASTLTGVSTTLNAADEPRGNAQVPGYYTDRA